MFGSSKELQKEILLISNIYGNKFNDLVNSLDKKIIIWLDRNTKGLQIQPAQSEDRFAGNSELEKKEGLKEMIKDEMDISIFISKS